MSWQPEPTRRWGRASRTSGTCTPQHLERACLLEHLDDLGLGPVEQKYLRAAAEGATRLNVIASMLGLPSRTVSTVIEPFLLRVGLVVKDDGGRRQITAQGKEHLSKSCADGVQLPSK
jgi:Holliday junction DNA helicase RuvB